MLSFLRDYIFTEEYRRLIENRHMVQRQPPEDQYKKINAEKQEAVKLPGMRSQTWSINLIVIEHKTKGLQILKHGLFHTNL